MCIFELILIYMYITLECIVYLFSVHEMCNVIKVENKIQLITIVQSGKEGVAGGVRVGSSIVEITMNLMQ